MTHAEWQALADAAQAARRARPMVPLAIATLLRVEGSSYRQPGARMLCDAKGRVLAGAISGGCLEGDVASRAAEVCRRGEGRLFRYDLAGDLDGIWGLGAACDGVATLLLEPLGEGAWLAAAAEAGARRMPGVVCTAFTRLAPLDGGGDVDGGAPALTGTAADHDVPVSVRTLVSLDDAAVRDTARGAARDASRDVAGDAALRTAADVAQRTGRSEFAAVDADAAFVSPLVPPVRLVIVGASRGAVALARVARSVGWAVHVVDARAAVLSALDLPWGCTTQVADADAFTASAGRAHPALDARTAVAICTHRFAEDVAWLAALLPLGVVRYVGVLGARARAARLLDAVGALGVDVAAPRVRGRVYAPMGLDLGGESPEGIALAAVAEIEAVLHGRPGGSLRERRSPIHGRTTTPAV